MRHTQRGSTEPKTKARAARYAAWLRTARTDELDNAYKAASKSFNAYQRRAIVDELRRRELNSEEVG